MVSAVSTALFQPTTSAASHHISLEIADPTGLQDNRPDRDSPTRYSITKRWIQEQAMTLARKLGIAALIIYTFTVTILRAFRTPNDFAEAHWLLDYRFGFVKRGLIGEILSLVTGALSIPITEQLIATLAIAALLTFCIVITVVSFRLVHRSAWSTGSVLVALAFLSSPFAVLSAHFIGYYDNITILLGIGAIALLLMGRPWLGAWVLVPSFLVHENTLVLAFAPFCLAWLLSQSRNQRLGRPRLSFLPLLLPLCAFLVMAVSQELFVSKDFKTLAQAYLSQFPFIQEDRNMLVPQSLSTSFLFYYSLYAEQFPNKIFAIDMHGLILPSTLAILLYIVNVYRLRDLSVESIFLLGVCFAPQLLQLVAVDTPRIWSYTILCAFLALWVYAETTIAHEDSAANRLLCLVALIANAVILTPLMDFQIDHYSLRTRLVLYTPVIVGSLALILLGGEASLAERLKIQGSTISTLLSPKQRDEAAPASTPTEES